MSELNVKMRNRRIKENTNANILLHSSPQQFAAQAAL